MAANVNKSVQKRVEQKRNATEGLAQALIEAGSITDKEASIITNINKLLDNENTPLQDKIEGLRNVQMLLLAPQVKALLGVDEYDIMSDKKATQARQVHWVIDGIIKGIYEQQDYTQREEIDFKHPKVMKAFEFIVQGVLETLKEIKVSDNQINQFVERFSTSMIGFENELDAKMFGISGKAIDQLENPLLKQYKEMKEAKTKAQEPNEDFIDLRNSTPKEIEVKTYKHNQQKVHVTLDEQENVKFVDDNNNILDEE